MFSLKTNSNQSSEPSDLVTTVVYTTDQRTANEGFERIHINFWWLKNGSLFAYFISAAIGIIVMTTLRFIFQPYRPEVLNEFLKGGRSYTLAPILLAMIIIVIVLYERPIRRLFNLRFKGRIIPMDLLTMARRRTLNEPYFVALLSVICGLVGAVVVVVANYRLGLPNPITRMGAPDALLLSIITATISFLALEFFLHRWLALALFPEGGLQRISGVWKISLRIRLISLFAAINLIPLAASLLTAYRTADSLEVLLVSLFVTVPIYVAAGFILTILMAGNLSGSLKNLTTVLRGVSQGNLASRVNVTSNDEIGYAGDVINEMTDGLIEREKMQQSLNLAREVQQNLLPKRNLKVNGFDIAGKSIYCDETGGDYYDFISIKYNDKQKIGVAIGDVSGHGISSALLMATVRSSLRQRASLPGSIANIISDVNRQLVEDVEDSGQFMTMFFLALNTESKQLEWVRAGHDPAIIYDPGTDSFNELGGSGIALGVDSGWIYEGYKKTDLSKGQIIFLSTDGVWEVRNKKGEMLGKETILNIIRQNSSSDATQIIDAIFDILDKFIGGVKIEDDITSVIIKMQN